MIFDNIIHFNIIYLILVIEDFADLVSLFGFDENIYYSNNLMQRIRFSKNI